MRRLTPTGFVFVAALFAALAAALPVALAPATAMAQENSIMQSFHPDKFPPKKEKPVAQDEPAAGQVKPADGATTAKSQTAPAADPK